MSSLYVGIYCDILIIIIITIIITIITVIVMILIIIKIMYHHICCLQTFWATCTTPKSKICLSYCFFTLASLTRTRPFYLLRPLPKTQTTCHGWAALVAPGVAQTVVQGFACREPVLWSCGSATGAWSLFLRCRNVCEREIPQQIR